MGLGDLALSARLCHLKALVARRLRFPPLDDPDCFSDNHFASRRVGPPHQNSHSSTCAGHNKMILTGPAIKSAVRRGDVAIEPFDERDINPNSYNYHLGDSLLVLGPGGSPIRKVTLTQEGYVLNPRKVYLAATLERIGSERYVTLLLGRSSVGRLGIFLNVTADLGHIGSNSHWTLELMVVQPVRIYPRMRIGQISFWFADGSSFRHYAGRYHCDTRPVPNRDRNITRVTR